LRDYLGTPEEIEFDEINKVISSFKAGEDIIPLKMMGRREGEISYEDVDFSSVQILLIEWTHGGSEYLIGVDLPVYIDSTPEKTLARRLKRNRDENAGSDLIKTVLEIEQEKLLRQAGNAKITVTGEGAVNEK
ncbi:MAG: alpha-galactosidase, partial [Lachnospiraceae bacterium]|nr:alpha-galactosidase [Lachnospiraceae bacterium]